MKFLRKPGRLLISTVTLVFRRFFLHNYRRGILPYIERFYKAQREGARRKNFLRDGLREDTQKNVVF